MFDRRARQGTSDEHSAEHGDSLDSHVAKRQRTAHRPISGSNSSIVGGVLLVRRPEMTVGTPSAAASCILTAGTVVVAAMRDGGVSTRRERARTTVETAAITSAAASAGRRHATI